MHEIVTKRVKTRGNRLEGRCTCRRWEIALNAAPEIVSPEREAADIATAAAEHEIHAHLSAVADILAAAAVGDDDIWLVSA